MTLEYGIVMRSSRTKQYLVSVMLDVKYKTVSLLSATDMPYAVVVGSTNANPRISDAAQTRSTDLTILSSSIMLRFTIR